MVGGLLSAHLLSQRAGIAVEEDWPCDGPLLRLAVDLARRLLPGKRLNTVRLPVYFLIKSKINKFQYLAH